MVLRLLPIRFSADPPSRGELHSQLRSGRAAAGALGKVAPVISNSQGENRANSKFEQESRVSVPNQAQPSTADGVADDMATLAIGNPGFAAGISGPGLRTGRSQHPGEEARSNQGSSGPARSTSDTGENGVAERTDADVMLAVAAGDEAGYTYLVEKYHRQIIHFLYRMVHNEAVAEELAQEVFLRVYRSRESYRAEAKFSTWLYRIATNLAVNHARDTKNERMAPTLNLNEPDPESGSMPEVADDDLNVEQTMLREERMAAIRMQVKSLPERQRMAVLMHKYQEMDYREIGDVLKLSESATKSLLFRAYQTLRERLKEFV